MSAELAQKRAVERASEEKTVELSMTEVSKKLGVLLRVIDLSS
jgi:hypothetical protein